LHAHMRLPSIRRAGRLRLLLGVAVATLAATAMTPGSASAATQICSNQSSTSAGSYYQMWSNGQGSACITLNSATSYTSTWNGIGDFVAGVGWNPGSTHTINFTSTLNASGGTTLLSLYGWSTNPLVEYYVEEDYIGSPNTAGTFKGTMTSDGATYNIYEHQQVNQPSIQGTATFEQYLAIRTTPTTNGTITTQNYINAWASHGMNLGTMNYQILATEAWGGASGNSNVTISTGGSTPPSSAPPSTTPPSSPASGPGTCKASYTMASSWTGGYQATVTVSNSGSSAINGWNVGLTLASGQTITSLWNGVNSGTSGAITVKNAAYNGSIGAGSSTTFGFTANGNGSAAPSSISCTSS